MMRRLTPSLAILLLCTACGAKSALEIPAGTPQQPLFEKLGRTAAPAADVSTPKKAQE